MQPLSQPKVHRQGTIRTGPLPVNQSTSRYPTKRLYLIFSWLITNLFDQSL
jgi:hypothetical protein